MPSYKGIEFDSARFAAFLQDVVIPAVVKNKPDVTDVRVVYDELNELDPKGDQTIIVICSFANDRSSAFHISAMAAFAACFAEDRLKLGGALDAFEAESHAQFFTRN